MSKSLSIVRRATDYNANVEFILLNFERINAYAAIVGRMFGEYSTLA